MKKLNLNLDTLKTLTTTESQTVAGGLSILVCVSAEIGVCETASSAKSNVSCPG